MEKGVVNSLNNNTLRSLLRNTFLLGGTQIVQLGSSLLKGKVVALFVGLAGSGLSSLFWSATSWIQQFTTLGLPVAAVKDIAAEKDAQKQLFLISLVKRFFILAAFAGALLCCVLSPALSYLSFGNYNSSLDFIYLSLMVWFAIMGAGELTVYQALNHVKPLSKASAIGAVVGVISGIPFYWIMGLSGIVWAFNVAAAATFFSLRYYLNKIVHIKPASISVLIKNKLLIGSILKSGLVLFGVAILASLGNFIIVSVIRAFGGIDEVGSYQSAYNIICQISGIVFAALATDYFPKLSASSGQNMHRLINNQIFVALGLTTPIMCLLMAGAPLAVEVLLSREYMVIVPLLRWFALAMIIRAVSYPLGYIALAKANRRFYFLLEGVCMNLLNFAGLIIGFFIDGVIGMGKSLVIIHLLDVIIYYIVCKKKFAINIDSYLLRYGAIAILFAIISLHLSLTYSDEYNILLYGFAFCSLGFLWILMRKTKKNHRVLE